MGYTLVEKILMTHTKDELKRGSSITINIDQCLAPDSNATLVFLELFKLNTKNIKPKCIIYIDHNTMQNGPMNMDDHIFYKNVLKNMVLFYQRQEMVFLIKYILKGLLVQDLSF